MSLFPQFLKSQNNAVKEQVAFIVFEEKVKLPSELILIPVDHVDSSNLEVSFAEALKLNENRVPLIYFQSLRWVVPDLEQKLTESKFFLVDIEGGDFYFRTPAKMKVVVGKLLFAENNYAEKLVEPINDMVKISFGEFKTTIHLYEYNGEIGSLNFYEPVH